MANLLTAMFWKSRRRPFVTSVVSLLYPRPSYSGAPAKNVPGKTFCYRKRVLQNHSESPFEVINHRRRRLGECQRVHKFGSQHTSHDAGATVAQARLALKHVRHTAHYFEHARRLHRGHAAWPQDTSFTSSIISRSASRSFPRLRSAYRSVFMSPMTTSVWSGLQA